MRFPLSAVARADDCDVDVWWQPLTCVVAYYYVGPLEASGIVQSLRSTYTHSIKLKSQATGRHLHKITELEEEEDEKPGAIEGQTKFSSEFSICILISK